MDISELIFHCTSPKKFKPYFLIDIFSEQLAQMRLDITNRIYGGIDKKHVLYSSEQVHWPPCFLNAIEERIIRKNRRSW